MKNYILKLSLALAITSGVISCKNNESKEDTRLADEIANVEEAVEFQVDTENSNIYWEGSKAIGKHNGSISLSEGKISFLEDKIVSGEFVIDINTITVLDIEGEDKASLEAHLKGLTKEGKDHFFNVEDYPTAGFSITGTSTEEGQLFLIGDLTIKDVTKQVSFPITLSKTDNGATLESEVFIIDRSQFNIKYKSKSMFEDLGDNFISDEIELQIKLSTASSQA